MTGCWTENLLEECAEGLWMKALQLRSLGLSIQPDRAGGRCDRAQRRHTQLRKRRTMKASVAPLTAAGGGEWS